MNTPEYWNDKLKVYCDNTFSNWDDVQALRIIEEIQKDAFNDAIIACKIATSLRPATNEEAALLTRIGEKIHKLTKL